MTAPARTWFVTGSSAGLGRSLVTELLGRGETVAATARNVDALAGLPGQHEGRLWTGQLDVTDPQRIRRVVDEAVDALGGIDVVVSNAGYGLFGAAEEATDEQIDQQISTNLTGPIHLARAVLPHLRARGRGRIVQLSSVAGQATAPGMAVYGATKWGVEGFFEALAAEVKGFGIGVTIVEPGTIRTDFTGRSRDMTRPSPAYEGTPAAVLRDNLEAGKVPYRVDLAKATEAIIDAATATVAPLRLALGSDSYRLIRGRLSARLTSLDRQKDLALSTDLSGVTVR